MNRKLFVGNLSFSTEEIHSDLFAQAGPVESVRVMRDQATGRSRGFGFVEMASEDAARAAIEKFNETEVDGRRPRRKRSQAPGFGRRPRRRLRWRPVAGGGGGYGGGRGGNGGGPFAASTRTALVALRRFLTHNTGVTSADTPAGATPVCFRNPDWP